MALWACRSCTTRYSVGAPACPQCGSTDSYEEGNDAMSKITVHGGPSIAGATVVGAAWSANDDESNTWPAGQEPEAHEGSADDGVAGEPVTVGEAAAEPVALHEGDVVASVSVDGVDQGPGVADEALGGGFEPLPEAAEGDTAEHVSAPDYEARTKTQLQEALAERELPTSGTKAELITRLRTHDEP